MSFLSVLSLLAQPPPLPVFVTAPSAALTVNDWIVIIGVLTAALVSVINAVGSYWGRKHLSEKVDRAAALSEDHRVTLATTAKTAAAHVASLVIEHAAIADSKLDHITELTNSSLQRALARIATLEALLQQAGMVVPPTAP